MLPVASEGWLRLGWISHEIKGVDKAFNRAADSAFDFSLSFGMKSTTYPGKVSLICLGVGRAEGGGVGGAAFGSKPLGSKLDGGAFTLIASGL